MFNSFLAQVQFSSLQQPLCENSSTHSVLKNPILAILNLPPGICLWCSRWRMTMPVQTKAFSFISKQRLDKKLSLFTTAAVNFYRKVIISHYLISFTLLKYLSLFSQILPWNRKLVYAQIEFSCYEERATCICRIVWFLYECYIMEMNYKYFNGGRKERVKQMTGQFSLKFVFCNNVFCEFPDYLPDQGSWHWEKKFNFVVKI